MQFVITPDDIALSTEQPIPRVTYKKGYDGRETLFCQLYGFYPKDIEVTWMKDEVDQKPETFTGGVVPNSDGTYHTWLSIDVDPKEKDRYRCRVGHDSLPETLDLAWEEPGLSPVGVGDWQSVEGRFLPREERRTPRKCSPYLAVSQFRAASPSRCLGLRGVS